MTSHHLNDHYQTDAKRSWRDYVYSLLTPDTCALLVDNDNRLRHKWLELVGDNAHTFNQLLSTGRIEESQLVGVDNRVDNATACSKLFPSAQFYGNDWDSFCRTYRGNDIGVIVFDSWNAGAGNDFKRQIDATLHLVKRCKDKLGECLLVVNVDGSKTHRSFGFSKGLDAREVLKNSMEAAFKKFPGGMFSTLVIDPGTMYAYRQSAKNTKMLSVGVLV
jgi:hypothetical protein